ncbi:MAG TPA: hypothetical protein VEI97_04475 [bacterium]|nr:hypothetical protein [bacterium]
MPTLPIGEPVPTLEFNFPAGWEVEEFDRDARPGHPAGFYRQTIMGDGVKHIRGVDIVCRSPDAAPRVLLIEVKDDRPRVTQSRERHEELRLSIQNKVLGTLAGLVIAERVGEASLQPMACLTRHPRVEVVLFLEEPPPAPIPNVGSKKKLRKQVRTAYKSNLDQDLSATLHKWGLPFHLYNLTNRQPVEWTVRPLP